MLLGYVVVTFGVTLRGLLWGYFEISVGSFWDHIHFTTPRGPIASFGREAPPVWSTGARSYIYAALSPHIAASHLRSTELLESFWDALWLELWAVVLFCFFVVEREVRSSHCSVPRGARINVCTMVGTIAYFPATKLGTQAGASHLCRALRKMVGGCFSIKSPTASWTTPFDLRHPSVL